MARHRGRGMASINYPIGMNLGGDPSQALVHSNPSGKFTVALSSIDLGQGMKSVTRQICAETLGVPVEDVYVDTADSDTCLLYTSPSPRDGLLSRMPSSA